MTFKILFLRTTWPISAKLDIKASVFKINGYRYYLLQGKIIVERLLLKIFNQTRIVQIYRYLNKITDQVYVNNVAHTLKSFCCFLLRPQVSFSDQILSIVVIVINFSHYHLPLQNHMTNFNQTWHKASLGERNSSLFK